MQSLALILGNLFIVRPLAIWLSLIGTDAQPLTRLFFGSFGPRGLATALFALLVVEQLDPSVGEDILYLAVNAVWISVVLHGLTAPTAACRYAHHYKNSGAGKPRGNFRSERYSKPAMRSSSTFY
ncbi:MAG: hypothetical protein AAED33_11610 [Paracoccaceae bacterium]